MMDRDSLTRRAELARRKEMLEQKALIREAIFAWRNHNNSHTDIMTGHIEDFIVTDDFLWIEEHGDAWVSVRIEWVQHIELDHEEPCVCTGRNEDGTVSVRYATYVFMNMSQREAKFDAVVRNFKDEPEYQYPKEMDGVRFHTTLAEIMSGYTDDKEGSHEERQEAQRG